MEASIKLGTTSANTIAEFIIRKYGSMSHLKLQKILFYCEAYHLAYTSHSLFPEEFEAWVHGPVSRVIYAKLKGAGMYSDIDYTGDSKVSPDELLSGLSSDQVDILNNVISQLSTWTALELESATHKESPWIDARNGCAPSDKCTNTITKESMRKFYSMELNGETLS